MQLIVLHFVVLLLSYLVVSRAKGTLAGTVFTGDDKQQWIVFSLQETSSEKVECSKVRTCHTLYTAADLVYEVVLVCEAKKN